VLGEIDPRGVALSREKKHLYIIRGVKVWIELTSIMALVAL
jgi:hypothetical protein